MNVDNIPINAGRKSISKVIVLLIKNPIVAVKKLAINANKIYRDCL